MSKEAKARIKINKLLEDAGWRFFDDNNGNANILLENNVKIKKTALNRFGKDFEKTTNGFIDFLLLDDKGFPFIVLEAKKEGLNPLFGKEQARKYAKGQNCRFVILSNGNLHYFWDLERGNPYLISQFPRQDSVQGFGTYKPNPENLINEVVNYDYIVITQNPDYEKDPQWQDTTQREEFIQKNKLKFLRPYQLTAVKSIQTSVKEGNDRFLFEMATGTGKTLIAAAVIKLFLRTGNAKRVLFLVDRLELEDQADKRFKEFLKNDFKTVIYKENKDNWRRAEIVVTTVQSLQVNNKYQYLFSPTDFDLIISDEAHRSIGGNSRAVFEYFIGYKLGLTATPKDYLRKIDSKKLSENDPRQYERRILLDTYKTFGCESGDPTYRYSLIDGVKDGYLVNPHVVDARTEITTEMLSEKGYSVINFSEEGEEEDKYYKEDFEKRFISDETNKVFCETFFKKAFKDPVSGEIGKSIMYCVSQNHAAKITQILNELADKMFPGKYNSDFAVQVTSRITGAQQYSINFSNNKLSGSGNFIEEYKTSKTRVCVTVGMMTTGYDCEDLLNLCFLRPIFSPTDFIQMKGRGTRKYKFTKDLFNKDIEEQVINPDKKRFKLFDFFADFEYFENEYNYDEIIELPIISTKKKKGEPQPPIVDYTNLSPDPLKTVNETPIGFKGMKIDRMFFQSFENKVKEDDFVVKNVEKGKWDKVVDYVTHNLLDKPEEFYTLEKLRRAINIDRRITLREVLEKIFGFINYFKTKDDLLNEEFNKFILIFKPDNSNDIPALKYYFRAYLTDEKLREIIEKKKLNDLYTNPSFNIDHYKAIGKTWRQAIPEYIKDYVSINQFMI